MDRTPWNPNWATAVERVKSLVESLFSCRVKFQTLDTFLDRSGNEPKLFMEQDLVFLESSLFEPPRMIRGGAPGAFAFPLRVRRAGAHSSDVSLVGVATIEGLAASSDDRLEQIVEFLQMAVESRLDAFERLLDIEQQERRFLDERVSRESSKVVRLFPHAPEEAPAFVLENREDGFDITKPVVLLGSEATKINGFPFSRIALDLFNRTSLWFFVNISDLSEDAFASAQAFRDLGRMCIYVPDLAELSIEKQLRIAEVFGEGSGPDGPRLVSVIHEKPAVLIGSGAILPHLLALMTPVRLDPALLEAAEPSSHTIQKVVQQIEAQLVDPTLNPESVPTKASNLIPLHGRWRQDDGSNPTFH